MASPADDQNASCNRIMYLRQLSCASLALILVSSVALTTYYFTPLTGCRSSRAAVIHDAAAGALLMETQTHKKIVLKHVMDYRNAYKDVYKPANYTVCEGKHVSECWPRLHKVVDCRRLFDEYEHLLANHVRVHPPPKQLAAGQEQAYLLNGYTSLKSVYYLQESHAPDAEVPIWTAEYIGGMAKEAKARKPSLGNYGESVQHVYLALDCHPVQGLHGAVFGTQYPWVESVIFAWGRYECTVVDNCSAKSLHIFLAAIGNPHLHWLT